MATPISISLPHQLGRVEARRRIETGFAKIVHVVPGNGVYSERWDDDKLTFSVAAMGQTVTGVINVLDSSVAMEIELSGTLGLLASGFKHRLQKVAKLLLTKK